MKTTNGMKWPLAAILAAGILFFTLNGGAQQLEPPGYSNPLLDSWSFEDTNGWTDDNGDAPISFTNIAWSPLGDFFSLVVNSNAPAWLNYEIYQTDQDWTNMIVNGPGSITFWYAPADWSSGTNGGSGPGQWAQLIDVGEWTPDSSYGYFGISIDPSGTNLLFSVQDGLGDTYALFTQVSWTTNYFHFIALTYSSTNVALYVDGQLATNDPGGLSIWPGPDVIANGVFFGSDTNGNEQAQGLLDTVETFDTPLGSNDVLGVFNSQNLYALNFYNTAMALTSAPFSPPSGSFTNSIVPDAVTGPGFLQSNGVASDCSYSSNPYNVWIIDVKAKPAGGGAMNVTFSIDGGTNGWMYDVFADSLFPAPLSSGTWSWMGQGLACHTYTLTNVVSPTAFLVLGTPWDSDGAELTDAYQLLVSKTNPNVQDSDLDGLITGWEVLLGLNPHISNIGSPSQQINYTYTKADWVTNVFGIKGGSPVSMDNEGNVTQVSQ